MSAVTGDVALAARDLRVERRAARFTLEIPSLELRCGEVLAILGPNGSGKSTLLRALAGLERGCRAAVGASRAGAVTMVFQHPAAFSGSVEHNVRTALLGRRLPRGERQERVREALERFAITGLAARRAHSLSGGELRRVALARAFALRPATLLLDEPFDDLDAAGQAALSLDLQRVIAETGVAVGMVTHDRRRAMLLSDRIAVLVAGRLVQLDRRDVVLERPVSRTVAELVGMSNLLAGVVREGRIEIDALRQLPARDLPAAGTRVLAGIRPEHLKLESGGDGVPIGKGHVASVVDDGTAATVAVEWGAVQLRSVVLTGEGLARSLGRGDSVSLSVRPEHVHLMPLET
jgi:ABC-type sulfate/molybdate transport systems ATPase subunit